MYVYMCVCVIARGAIFWGEVGVLYAFCQQFPSRIDGLTPLFTVNSIILRESVCDRLYSHVCLFLFTGSAWSTSTL